MGGEDGGGGGEVGDGAGYLENAVVGAGREVKPLHGFGQRGRTLRVGRGEAFEQGARHLRVAVDALEVLVTLRLYGSGFHHALADGRTRFACRGGGEVGHADGGNFYLYVDAVEQRAGDFPHVFLYLRGRAVALVGGVVVVAAGAGVHGGHEHEGAGERDGVLGAGDSDFAVFERLAERFEGGAGELRQFVKE